MGCSRNKQTKNSIGCSRSSSKKELYSNTSISRKQQSQTTNLTLYIKEWEKEEQTKSKISTGK